MEVVACWEPAGPEESAAHRKWVLDLFSALAPHALPGGYPNFLTHEDREQIGSAYGNNAVRLRALKRWYDPDNIFSSTIPLPR